MSSRGEIKALCDIALPDYAVITNIGDSHLEFLINRDNVFLEKSEIKNYVSPENLILFGDDVYLKNLSGIKIGFEKNNDYVIENYHETAEGTAFEIEGREYIFPMNGKHNCINASLGVSMGKLAGLSDDEIRTGLLNCKVTSMRFEKKIKNGITYINDAYNASPVSMRYSLETLENAYKNIPKIAVLADMGELGKDELKYHEDILRFAVSLDIDKIILFGKLMKEASKVIENREKAEKLITAETKDEIKEIIRKNFTDRVILLKGSNFNHLWEIME